MGHIYRIDKFIVPHAARAEFLSRVRETHDLLRQQAGFVRDSLLEQMSGPGEFNFVTIVEWESQAHLEGARHAVVALHEKSNFDPQEFRERFGIRADIANYVQLDA